MQLAQSFYCLANTNYINGYDKYCKTRLIDLSCLPGLCITSYTHQDKLLTDYKLYQFKVAF